MNMDIGLLQLLKASATLKRSGNLSLRHSESDCRSEDWAGYLAMRLQSFTGGLPPQAAWEECQPEA